MLAPTLKFRMLPVLGSTRAADERLLPAFDDHHSDVLQNESPMYKQLTATLNDELGLRIVEPWGGSAPATKTTVSASTPQKSLIARPAGAT